MRHEVFVNAAPGETRLALLEDGLLIEYVNSRIGERSSVGAVHLGRIVSISRPLQAAFVDIGAERAGLLGFADTDPDAPKLVEGAAVAVRIVRDPVEDKGAKLDARLAFDVPAGARAPMQLAPAPDPIEAFLVARASPSWRIVADDRRFKTAEYYASKTPIFAEHDIEGQLEAALSSDVALPGGGSLVIEETAALVAIDVNSGPRGDAHEVNLAAARETARQLRLRNLAGQIVIDFLPEKRRDRREDLLAALRSAVASDPNEVHVLGLTRLGLAELTRRRIGESLATRMGVRRTSVRSAESATLELLRVIDEQARIGGVRGFSPAVSFAIDELLNGDYRSVRDDLVRRHALTVTPEPDAGLRDGEYRL